MYIAAEEKHWHRVVPDSLMVHIAINLVHDTDGAVESTAEWMGEVTEEEYPTTSK